MEEFEEKSKPMHIRTSTNKPHIQIFITVWIVFCTLFSLVPLTITILNSLKTDLEVKQSIFAMPQFMGGISDVINNYKTAWAGKSLQGITGIDTAFLRSIYVALVQATIGSLIGSVLGYVFTYKKFYFKEVVFMIYLAVLMLPSMMGMPILVPFMVNVLHLNDTYFGYVLPILAGGQVSATFLFRTFFGQQPTSIYESARVEGANDIQVFTHITVPLAFPIIMYYFVGAFGSTYADYLWPMLILPNHLTLMPTMRNMQANLDKMFKGAEYAMYIISSIPLIITSIISMKYFASGEFASGMKL